MTHSLVLIYQVQRVFQIGSLKRILQQKLGTPVTPKVLKTYFDQNLEIKSGEAATEHFLSTAVALWNAFFSIPRLKAAWLLNDMFVVHVNQGCC